MRDQREYEAQLTQHALNMHMRMQAKPLPVDIVNSIPISKYTSETVKNANCAICLEDYEEDKNEVRILGCGHGFCVLCIGKLNYLYREKHMSVGKEWLIN